MVALKVKNGGLPPVFSRVPRRPYFDPCRSNSMETIDCAGTPFSVFTLPYQLNSTSAALVEASQDEARGTSVPETGPLTLKLP